MTSIQCIMKFENSGKKMYLTNINIVEIVPFTLIII